LNKLVKKWLGSKKLLAFGKFMGSNCDRHVWATVSLDVPKEYERTVAIGGLACYRRGNDIEAIWCGAWKLSRGGKKGKEPNTGQIRTAADAACN
jgi:hypothetical protein